MLVGSTIIGAFVAAGGTVASGIAAGIVAASGDTRYAVACLLSGISGVVAGITAAPLDILHAPMGTDSGAHAEPRMSCVHTGETTSATRLSTTVQRPRGSMQGSAQRRCERAFGYNAHCRCDQLDPVQAMQTTCEREAQPVRRVRLQDANGYHPLSSMPISTRMSSTPSLLMLRGHRHPSSFSHTGTRWIYTQTTRHHHGMAD
ncbi:UNVERIFIED_CONTAM: hypothetical protein PYX00_011487 [Menopon gallinae]|uniref:Uncharacterized protein n=1 Tax=Menopon gallinae TaxID=328185 RepID=A0AAW2H7K5_9NEOP